MKRKYFLIGLFFFLSTLTFSQVTYHTDGYVVTMKRDTIYGELEDLGEERNCRKIKFYNPDGKRIKYKAKDVYAYKRGNDIYYKKSYERPIAFSNMLGYMKLIQDGQVKLYRFDFTVQHQGFAGPDGIPTGGYTSSDYDYYLESNNRFDLVRSMSFRELMSKYFADNEDLMSKINSKELRYKDIEAIVVLYNQHHADN